MLDIKKILFGLTLIAGISLAPGARAVDTVGVDNDIQNTVMIEGVEQREMVSVMTGGVLDIPDEDGYKYIITARHGIIDPKTGDYIPKRGIIIKTFHGTYLGLATVGYCDPHRDGAPGQEINEYNIAHDVCVLKMMPGKVTPQYHDIRGYTLPSSFGSTYFSMCHRGLASWDQGASGSPIFEDQDIFQGVLSATYDEEKIPEMQWKQMLADRNIKVPEQVLNAPPNRPVVISSCAVFVPPTPGVLMYLGVNPDTVRWVNDPIPDGASWGSLSLPVFRPVYIRTNQKNSVDTDSQ